MPDGTGNLIEYVFFGRPRIRGRKGLGTVVFLDNTFINGI